MSDFILKEPIDYESLSKAYELCRWRWTVHGSRWGEIPKPNQIIETVNKLKSQVESGDTDYCSTGGLTVRKVNEKLVVSIDGKLMEKYQHKSTPVLVKDR